MIVLHTTSPLLDIKAFGPRKMPFNPTEGCVPCFGHFAKKMPCVRPYERELVNHLQCVKSQAQHMSIAHCCHTES